MALTYRVVTDVSECGGKFFVGCDPEGKFLDDAEI